MGSSSLFIKYYVVLLFMMKLCTVSIAEDGSTIGFHGTERYALLAIRAEFNNPKLLQKSWKSLMCYMNNTPNWYGISCINGRVTGLVLQNLGLTGKLKAKKTKKLKKMLMNSNTRLAEVDKMETSKTEITTTPTETRSVESRSVASEVELEKGKLIFLGSEINFELDDLLRTSAEGLGKGNFGNCYKAMLVDGPTVVVKRLRDLKPLTNDEFVRQVRAIGDIKHPNLLPILGYYYTRDEKLLLLKSAPNGSLYNRTHGGKGTRDRIPFRWSSRLSVARGVAQALEHLHLNVSSSQFVVPHGNLKSTNVLLDENDDVRVADFGLTSLIALPIATQRMVSYRSPEYLASKKVTKKSDIWSFGCPLLELLTGRISSHSAAPGVTGADLCSWVHRAI